MQQWRIEKNISQREYNFYMPSQRASATMNCPANGNGCSIAKTYAITQTETWDAGGGLDIKFVKLNGGYHWAEALTNSSTYSFNLKPGQRGSLVLKLKDSILLEW